MSIGVTRLIAFCILSGIEQNFEGYLSELLRMLLQALFCQVTPRHVLNMCDVSNIWHVPIMMEAQGAHKSICDILGLGGYSNMNLTGLTVHTQSLIIRIVKANL